MRHAEAEALYRNARKGAMTVDAIDRENAALDAAWLADPMRTCMCRRAHYAQQELEANCCRSCGGLLWDPIAAQSEKQQS